MVRDLEHEAREHGPEGLARAIALVGEWMTEVQGRAFVTAISKCDLF